MYKVLSTQAFPYKVHSRGITQKASKGEQPFLHATHRLDLIYMPTKYYQNISKGINPFTALPQTLLVMKVASYTPQVRQGWEQDFFKKEEFLSKKGNPHNTCFKKQQNVNILGSNLKQFISANFGRKRGYPLKKRRFSSLVWALLMMNTSLFICV